MPNTIIFNNNIYQFNCPHCNITIEVQKNQINCQIFRCGVLKSNGNQIGPHTCKAQCDLLKQQDKIWGCGKPFKFDGNKVQICDYI